MEKILSPHIPDLLMDLHGSDECVSALLRLGRYEMDLATIIYKGMRGCNADFIDIGANVGWHTVHAAKTITESGRVFAFEPAPENCEKLRNTLAANGVQDRVTVLPYAVADISGTARLYLAGSDNLGDHRLTNPKGQVRDFINVTTVRLDDIAIKFSIRALMIKIDAQGAEVEIMKGMPGLLSMQPFMVIEFCPDCLGSLERVEEFLTLISKYPKIGILGLPGIPNVSVDFLLSTAKSTQAYFSIDLMMYGEQHMEFISSLRKNMKK